MATNDWSWISTIDSRATAPIYNSTRLSTNQPHEPLKNRVCLSMNRHSRYDPVVLSMRPDVLSTNRTSAEYMCKSMTWNKTLWTASDIDQTRTHIILWPKQLFSITAQSCSTWWRHQMETFSALLAYCAGNSPVTGEFPSQRPKTPSFDVLFDLHLNQQLRNTETPVISDATALIMTSCNNTHIKHERC